MLKIIVTHSVLSINAEKRFAESMTVGELKQKLQMIVGSNPGDMILQHRNDSNEVLCTLQPDTKTLSEFNLQNFSNIHVVDEKGDQGLVGQIAAMNNGQMAAVPKYEISEEEYKKRDDTFAKWKEKNLQEFYQKKQDDEKAQIADWDHMVESKKMKVNDRCEITKNMKHRGKIAFIGNAILGKGMDKKGMWIGVILDEPYGDNNGTIKGKTYFKCDDKYGIFVRPDIVEVGDFPVIDELELSDDDDEEL